uniref:SixA phosphatase family protein n=1 Tax=Crenothrix sp. TaxID=3100433 RepID=UPI00374DCF82
VCDGFGIDHRHIQQEKRLYDEGLVRVKSVLADCPASFSRVLLVGHNPELEDLLTYLVNEADLPGAKKLFPTAALARLMLPDDWSPLDKGCAQLLSITYPKSLFEESVD